MFEVGKRIRIVALNDPYASRYIGKEGVITNVEKDPWGDTRLEGTWCGIALYPCNGDTIEEVK